MNQQNIELPTLPEIEVLGHDAWQKPIYGYSIYTMRHLLRREIESDRKQRLEGGKAFQDYMECGGDKESDPIERLRFYCSLAMSGQDWLDAEQFFDSLIADRKRIATVVESAWREGWAACRDAEYSGSEAEDFAYGDSRANYIALRLGQGEPCETSGEAARKQKGELVVTKNGHGEIVAVTRQDEEGQILSVIAEANSKRRGEPVELQGISEALSSGGGFWRSCSGCHELNEGHDTGPYSKTLKCHLGNGCSECGGIGAIWDNTDYDEMADYMMRDMEAPQPAGSVNAESLLQDTGVFKGAESLRRLADSDSFWDEQPYSTRLYFGDGVGDYLHRDVLNAAVKALDIQQPDESEKSHLKVTYDDKTDCLYITCDSNEVAFADEDDLGILHRRAVSDGRLVGITIQDFIGKYSKRV